MSKIGKKTISIPSGVITSFHDGVLEVKGKNGELKKEFPNNVVFEQKDGVLSVSVTDGNKAIWGLSRSLAANMIKGVTDGFSEILEFGGVGYKAQANGNKLDMSVGFTHPVQIVAPKEITFTVEKNTITVKGNDKEVVGQVAAKIRAQRPTEPYKGSGIKYKDEIIRRKAGKKATSTGTT